MEPRHERIAKTALAAGARYGLALAGGYAVSAHGMGDRPSGDVDLFTGWQHRGEFPALKAAVITALEAAGYKASVIMSAETFTRLILTDPEGGTEEKVELSVDWRAHDPVHGVPLPGLRVHHGLGSGGRGDGVRPLREPAVRGARGHSRAGTLVR
jgi:hypothetical protein